MKSAVSNSGPLIHLAKVGKLELLKLYEVLIPSQVKIEIVDRGKERGHGDAIVVEDAIKEGWIKVIDIKIEKKFIQAAENAGLHEAEIAVIFYAYEEKYLALLDDDPARIFARDLGIKVKGSLGILVKNLKEKKVVFEEALRALDDLASIMYLSSDLYKMTLKELEKYKY